MNPDAGPGAEPRSGAPTASAELELLAAQLTRMRSMLFGYSERFFERIRTWALVSLALLVLGSTDLAPAAVVPVPFLVPFAFLETGYLFWHTVFARRHAERLERAINERFGHEVLAAHRLEAAYFYEPDAPKVAALSLRRPFGFMSAMTIGYTAGAALLWSAGMIGLATWVERGGPGMPFGLAIDLRMLLVPAALAWTLAIAGYLVWASLARRDENRLVTELDRAYRAEPDR